MSHAAVIDAFPRRPVRLVADPKRAKSRRLWLAALFLLLLPGLYWGWSLWQNQQLREYLRASGVEAEVLSAEGTCFSRRQISGDSPRGCNYEIEYQVRKEHGGGTRRADVRLDGARPIFTPPALYDPADPDRVMFRPEAERDLRWSEWIGVPFALLIPIAGIALWLMTRTDPLEAAAAEPKPVAIPVERFARQGRLLQVWYRDSPGGKERLQAFAEGSEPFLLDPPDGDPQGAPWALALLDAKGRPVLLDRELRRLDLSEAERTRIRGSA